MLHASSRTAWFRRGLMIGLPFLMAGLLIAQNPKGKPADDDDTKAKPKKKIADDDDDVKSNPKKKVDDDDTPKPKTGAAEKPRPKVVGDDKIDLTAEAAKASTTELKAHFLELAHPFDRLNHRNTGWLNTLPVDVYVGERPNETKVPYTPLLAPGKPDKLSTSATIGELSQAKHYEQIAIERAKDFLANGLTRRPGDKDYLPRLDQLTAADKMLTAAMQFNDVQRGANKRKGKGWDQLRESLRAELLTVLVDELKELDAASVTDKQAGLRAADVAARISEGFPDTLRAHREVAIFNLNQAGNSLREHDGAYIKGAQTLQELLTKFPGSDPKVLEPLRDKLKRRALAHLEEAKRLATESDSMLLARNQLEMAELIAPDLEGLKEARTQLNRNYRLLVVGVPELPQRMSPALAITDADRWAIELLFESLVKPVPDAAVGQRYRMELAAGQPRLIPMGREFRLVRDAVWAGKDGPGEPLTAFHVKKTIELMQEHRGLPVAERIDLLQSQPVQDPYLIRVNLDRGSLEPLAALAFKVLPTQILEKRPKKLLDPEFAANPVGSGPYLYLGRRTEDGQEYAVFRANPAYGTRAGKFGRPAIQEIRFVGSPTNPVADLRDGKIDLLLDVPSDVVASVRTPELSRLVADVTLRNQRIWMLAVNHRKPELGQETGKALRRALAHAVDRDTIVQALRAGTLSHRALTGPFPPDSWATPTAPPATPLFRPEYALSMVKQAKAPAQLTLKCGNDATSRKACELIKQQIEQQNLGIRLEVTPLSAADLHQAVCVEHNFELAYVPYDYNEVYSLSGLLDPEAVGRDERNFLGYTPDPNLSQLLRLIRGTRNFGEVRKWTNVLFTAFNEQMPFIPLWQLDFHAVVSQNLQTRPLPGQLESRTIFDQVDEWVLNR